MLCVVCVMLCWCLLLVVGCCEVWRCVLFFLFSLIAVCCVSIVVCCLLCVTFFFIFFVLFVVYGLSFVN